MKVVLAKLFKIQEGMTPLKITAIYLVVGGFWIFASDQILSVLVGNPASLWRLQSFKGSLFVLATAYMLYFLISRGVRAVQRSREELLASEAKYRELVQCANSIILRMDTRGNVTFFNEYARNFFGYSEEEINGRNVVGTIVPEKDPAGRDLAAMIKDIACHPERYENNVNANMKRSGERVWIAWTNRAIRDAVGNIAEILCIGNDITQRRKIEKELVQTNDYLENILESSPDAIGIVDRRGRIIKCSRMAGELYGFDFAEFKEQNAFDLYADAVERDKMYGELRRKGSVKRYEIDMKRKDGSIFPAEISISLLKNSADVTIGSVSVVRDLSDVKETMRTLRGTNDKLRDEIAERQRVEDALRESEDAYRTIFENTGTATAIVEEDTTISLASSEFERLTGYSRDEIEGNKRWTEFVFEEDLQKVLEYLRIKRDRKSAIPHRYEFRLVNREGDVKHILSTIGMIPGTTRSVASLLDITEQRKLEVELLRAQKLESLGVLAGGIAHDFNNILTAIMGNVSLARMHAFHDEEMVQRLQEAEKACLRARDLGLQLLTFSKGGAPVKRTLNIGDLIKDSVRFALRGSNVRCAFSIPGDLWPVNVDEGQLCQVINNLAINADQAMPGGGVITVSAENLRLDTSRLLPVPGSCIRISVRDEGVGIPAENLSRIFDPYFSTKTTGSGLGLASAYSIIHKHDGVITVESDINVGTTFHIYLPVSDEKSQQPQPERDDPFAGNGRVLVMDDEKTIREVAADMLKHLGYDVVAVEDGAEAIAKYEEAVHSGRLFTAVIMDLTIPGGMGGAEAVKRLLEVDPEAKAIVSSGYSNDPVMAEFEKYGFAGVVSKPYRIEELSSVLHKVVARRVEVPAGFGANASGEIEDPDSGVAAL